MPPNGRLVIAERVIATGNDAAEAKLFDIGVIVSLGRRAVLKFRHVPEQLFDLVMTPIMFTLLFTYIFGGARAGSPGHYLQYFLPGILVQTVVFNTVYSGMGLSTDICKSLFDRFRSLPIWSLAPFAGLMVGDILRHLIAATIILIIDLMLGYRPEAGFLGIVGALLLLVTIGFGVGWIFIALGLLIRTPMTVMTIGFFLPLPARPRIQHHGRSRHHASLVAGTCGRQSGVADGHGSPRSDGQLSDPVSNRRGADRTVLADLAARTDDLMAL